MLALGGHIDLLCTWMCWWTVESVRVRHREASTSTSSQEVRGWDRDKWWWRVWWWWWWWGWQTAGAQAMPRSQESRPWIHWTRDQKTYQEHEEVSSSHW